MEEVEEYDSLVEIDEYNLDREWLNQPGLFMKYALALADAKLVHSEKKAALDVVEADLALRIRNDPTGYGLPKPTEKAIEATMILQEDYRVALKKLNRARHKVDILQAVVDTLDHRKRTLENLVTLHGQNYFSEPRVKAKDKEALDEVTKKSVRKTIKKKS